MNYKLSQEDVQKALFSLTTSSILNEGIRENEVSAIENFLDSSEKNGCGAMLVSGPPGTGKTCFVRLATKKIGTRLQEINCTGISEEEVFHSIFSKKISFMEGLSLLNENTEEALKYLGLNNRKQRIVVLDEADYLLPSNNQRQKRTTRSTQAGRQSRIKGSLLGGLLRAATNSKSTLILIAIVNSVEIMDVIRESLSAECKDRFKDICFSPYSENELKNIIKYRLESTTGLPVTSLVDNGSLTICAKKLAQAGGDSRLALDACHRLIQKLESDMEFEKLISPTKKMKICSPDKSKSTHEENSGSVSTVASTPSTAKATKRKKNKNSRLAVEESDDSRTFESQSTASSVQFTPSPSILQSPVETPKKSNTPAKSRIGEMNSILKNAGRNITGTTNMNVLKDMITGMPLHQRLVLCTLSALSDNGKDLTSSNVLGAYRKACEAKHLQPSEDFKELMSHAAAVGIFQESDNRKKKIPGKQDSGKLILNFSSQELETSLLACSEEEGVGLFEGFLEFVKAA